MIAPRDPSENAGGIQVPAGPNPPPWGAFAYSDYRVLWGVLVTVSLVSWMRILGTAQWLFDETGSAALVGFIGVVQLVVQIPALLWGGALADRRDRKRVMALANVATAVTLLGLAILNWQGLLTPSVVYVGIAITAGAQMFASPARSALVSMVIPRPRLLLAASTDTASQNAAAIVGPLLFAAIAVHFGLTEVFLCAGLISLVSSFLPLLVRVSGVAERQGDEPPASMLAQTKEGFRFVTSHPLLPGLFLLDIGITAASFYREILPVLALGLFAGGASATGMLGAANSAGAVVGAFVALLFVRYRAKGMLVLYASFAYGVVLFGFGTANSLWMGMVMIACLGIADAVTVAVRQTTVMLTTPDHMRGRAFALMILAAQTANNIGTIWVGAWAGVIGASNTMLLAGVISIAATGIIWRAWRPIRDFRS
ncbi:MAG: MFS transporter [Chromatiales bacterium]|jgi:MFS family permease|nr:MFS transporter [Chromatiales bacterium]